VPKRPQFLNKIEVFRGGKRLVFFEGVAGVLFGQIQVLPYPPCTCAFWRLPEQKKIEAQNNPETGRSNPGITTKAIQTL
jgi:hypothetical protein